MQFRLNSTKLRLKTYQLASPSDHIDRHVLVSELIGTVVMLWHLSVADTLHRPQLLKFCKMKFNLFIGH